MRLRYWVLLIVLAGAGVAAWQIDRWKSQPPEIPFTHVVRETIVSVVPTNGKVEPVESAIAHAERSGAVEEILIQLGQHVAKGDELLKLDASDAIAEREGAESRIAQIRTQLEVISDGAGASAGSGSAAERSGNGRKVRVWTTRTAGVSRRIRGYQAEQIATASEVTARKHKSG